MSLDTLRFLTAAEHAARRHLRRKDFPFVAECVDLVYRGENGIHIFLESRADIIAKRPLACLRDMRNHVELRALELVKSSQEVKS